MTTFVAGSGEYAVHTCVTGFISTEGFCSICGRFKEVVYPKREISECILLDTDRVLNLEEIPVMLKKRIEKEMFPQEFEIICKHCAEK